MSLPPTLLLRRPSPTPLPKPPDATPVNPLMISFGARDPTPRVFRLFRRPSPRLPLSLLSVPSRGQAYSALQELASSPRVFLLLRPPPPAGSEATWVRSGRRVRLLSPAGAGVTTEAPDRADSQKCLLLAACGLVSGDHTGGEGSRFSLHFEASSLVGSKLPPMPS